MFPRDIIAQDFKKGVFFEHPFLERYSFFFYSSDVKIFSAPFLSRSNDRNFRKKLIEFDQRLGGSCKFEPGGMGDRYGFTVPVFDCLISKMTEPLVARGALLSLETGRKGLLLEERKERECSRTEKWW